MPQTTDTTPDLLRFLRRLRAVREYTPEPIPEAVIEDLLEVGRWTATGGNRQPIDVVVVRDPAVKEKMGEWGAKPAATAGVVFLLVSNGDANAMDEGRMAERLQLAAAAHGLGSTLATLKNTGPTEAKQLLGIPEDKRAVGLVAVGNIDTAARAARPKAAGPARRPMTEYAHRDRW
jgi:nitroreductase